VNVLTNGLAVAAVVTFATVAGGSVAEADGYGSPPVYGRAPVAYERPYMWSNWSGFYVGANTGYGWSPNADQLALFGDFPTGLSPAGGFAGGQIGYNWQFNRLVIGAEADIQGAGISDSVQAFNFADRFQSGLNWFGTVRGRLGYSFDRTLVYVTGGFAYGGVHNSVDVGGVAPYRFDGTAAGYVLGAGLEYKLNPAWSIKGEYQYINLGANDPTSPTGARYSNIFGGGNATVRDDDYHTFRLGLNYRFGPREEPRYEPQYEPPPK
jgi:outer membrane immunogenic protein